MDKKELLEIYAREKEEAFELGDAQRLLKVSCELYKALTFKRSLSALTAALLVSGAYLIVHFVK